MSGDVPDTPNPELEQALQVIAGDPTLARRGVEILRDELGSAVGLERKAIIAAITALERPSDQT